jgi:His/Glu/Gln/Arg/opine family amino acid ABC transporter permease subunit
MSYSDVLSIFSGALTTLLLSVAGIALGLPIGLGLALLRWARVPALARCITVYVSLLRAAPLVTLLLLLFYGLPNMGIEIGPIAAGVVALTMNTSAFYCEIWRSALLAFPQEQLDAARATGMRRGLCFRRIVLPQIARTSVPALVNEMSQLIKVTPVLAIVGVVDITRAAVRVGADTYDPLPPFCVALAIYIPIIFALVSIQRWVERRKARLETSK